MNYDVVLKITSRIVNHGGHLNSIAQCEVCLLFRNDEPRLPIELINLRMHHPEGWE